MRAMITGTGLIVAFGLALGTASTTASFFGKVFVGAIGNIDKVLLSKLPQGSKLIYELRFAVLALQSGMVGLAAPILIAVAAIAAVIAVFVLAYQKSEILRDAIKDLVDGVMVALKEGWEKIKTALKDAMPFIDGIGDAFKLLGDFLGKYIVPFFKEVLVGAINIAVEVIVKVIEIVGGLIGKVTSVISFFADMFTKAKEIFGKINGLSIGDIFAGIKTGFKSAINFVIKKWNDLQLDLRLPKSVFGIPLGPLAGKGFTIDTPDIPLLARGGVVYPSTGGTLATLAEAGRPERVEPLDPDGLSKRDKAMIQLLAGNAGGGINITVNPSAGMDERELASLVSRQLAFQLRKGAA
jgi:hypothetical protein